MQYYKQMEYKGLVLVLNNYARTWVKENKYNLNIVAYVKLTYQFKLYINIHIGLRI